MKYIWLSGTEEEIAEITEAFRANGFTFTQDSFFEISNSPFAPGRYSSALKDFCPPAIPTPQPKSWDAVLGGKNR